MSIEQFGLMAHVASATDDTLSALAARGGFQQSTLSRNLAVLARLGWVEIVTAEKDKRKRAAWLTETGARKLAAAMPIWRAAQKELAREIDIAPVCAVGEACEALAVDLDE